MSDELKALAILVLVFFASEGIGSLIKRAVKYLRGFNERIS